MKFLLFSMFDAAKATDVSQASDKVWASPPPGIKALADYVCLAIPFPGGLPPNTVASVMVVEAESAEAMVGVAYPFLLAGATVWYVPVMELPVAAAAEAERKARG